VPIPTKDDAILAAYEPLLKLIKALLVIDPSKQPTVTEFLAKYSSRDAQMFRMSIH
jgi:hypothetical protein